MIFTAHNVDLNENGNYKYKDIDGMEENGRANRDRLYEDSGDPCKYEEAAVKNCTNDTNEKKEENTEPRCATKSVPETGSECSYDIQR